MRIDVTISIVCLVLCILGILIHNFKMYFLISGYNMMSETKKKKYDIEKFAKAMRNVFFTGSFLMFTGMFFIQDFGLMSYFNMIIIIGMVIFLIVYGQSKKIKLTKE